MEAVQLMRSKRLPGRVMDGVAELDIKVKVRIVLLLFGLVPPIVFMLLLQYMQKAEISSVLALYIAGFVILFYPLSCLLQEMLVLRQAGHINTYVEEVKQGRRPHFHLPRDEDTNNGLVLLKRNIFWMVQSLGLREERLQTALAELTESRRQVREGIEYAGLIQRSFLPSAKEMRRVLGDHMLVWQPRDQVGGDAFWIKEVDGGTFVAVMDCTGHGVAGAFLTLIVNSLLEQQLEERCRTNPSLLLDKMNKAMRKALSWDGPQDLGNGYDGSVCFIDRRKGMLHYAGANGIAYIKRKNDLLELRGNRGGVGFARRSSQSMFFSQSLPLDEVQAVYLATDGIIEQVGGPKGLPFGRKRLKSLLQENVQLPFALQGERIREALGEYRGRQEQRDDMTLLGFSWR